MKNADDTGLLSEDEKNMKNIGSGKVNEGALLDTERICDSSIDGKEGFKMKHVGPTLNTGTSRVDDHTDVEANKDLGDELSRANLMENDITISSIILTDDSTKQVRSNTTEISSIPFFKKRTLQFIIYALGICISFIMSGIFSEKLLRGAFGKKSESFSFISVFVFIQNVVNFIYAEVLLRTILKSDKDQTNEKLYALASFSNCCSMYLANKSLIWINYPTQVLGKSAKPIPVMMFNVLIGKQRYSCKKYFFVTLVVMGVSIFVIMSKSASADLKMNLGWGEFCVLISLLLDGITGAAQERMRQDYKTKPGHFMSNLNKWSMLYVGICVLASQEITNCYDFVMRFPVTRYYLCAIAICSALGQTFIFLMVSHFGSLSCSLVTTTRKFFTILGSIIIFRHSMEPLQWLGTFLVFLGLLLDSYYSNKEQNSKT